jgi:endoglucanase
MHQYALAVRDGTLGYRNFSNLRPLQRAVSLYWSQWGAHLWTPDTVWALKEQWKADAVRIPLGSHPDGLGYRSPNDKGDTLKWAYELIDKAIEHNMYVIVDCHDHDAVKHPLEALTLLYAVANKYGDNPFIIYEICNEPLEVSWEEIKAYAELVIPVIRTKAPGAVCIVGTPEWCSDLAKPYRNPLQIPNVMYAYHFYAGSHKQAAREDLETYLMSDFPVFVTECGASNADGNGALDYEQFDKWLDLLERQYQVPWCAWAVNDKAESSSVLEKGKVLKDVDGLTDYGIFLRDRIMKPMGSPQAFAPYFGSPYGGRNGERQSIQKLMTRTVSIPVALLPKVIMSLGHNWDDDDISTYMVWLSHQWHSIPGKDEKENIEKALKSLFSMGSSGIPRDPERRLSVMKGKTLWAVKRLLDTISIWKDTRG